MKALTIWQPWASLIIAGAKPYEFRSWAPPRYLIGHPLAVHAGARKMRLAEIDDLLSRLLSPNAWTTCLEKEIAEPILRRCRRDLDCLPYSHVVGTAVLGEPKRGEEIAKEFGAPSANDSDRLQHSNWGWPMLSIHPLEPPQPARGAQGLWDWRS